MNFPKPVITPHPSLWKVEPTTRLHRMQKLAITFTDQQSEYEFPLTVRNIKIIGAVMFIHCLDVSDAQRLFCWILEICDVDHLLLELDTAVAEMLVIDLCYFDQYLNLKIETPTE
jgi:hypothetical protein